MFEYIINLNITLGLIATAISIVDIVLNSSKSKETDLNEKEKILEKLRYQLYELNILFPGTKEKVINFINWIENHKVLTIILFFIMGFVPILNLIIICSGINSIINDK